MTTSLDFYRNNTYEEFCFYKTKPGRGFRGDKLCKINGIYNTINSDKVLLVIRNLTRFCLEKFGIKVNFNNGI